MSAGPVNSNKTLSAYQEKPQTFHFSLLYWTKEIENPIQNQSKKSKTSFDCSTAGFLEKSIFPVGFESSHYDSIFWNDRRHTWKLSREIIKEILSTYRRSNTIINPCPIFLAQNNKGAISDFVIVWNSSPQRISIHAWKILWKSPTQKKSKTCIFKSWPYSFPMVSPWKFDKFFEPEIQNIKITIKILCAKLAQTDKF